MAKHIPRRHPVLKVVIMVIICSAVAGAILYKFNDNIRGLTRGARSGSLIPRGLPASAMDTEKPPAAVAEKPATGGKKAAVKTPEKAQAKPKRTPSDSEVRRLREELAVRQRENDELKIQLKLLREGSRTKD